MFPLLVFDGSFIMHLIRKERIKTFPVLTILFPIIQNLDLSNFFLYLSGLAYAHFTIQNCKSVNIHVQFQADF